MYEEMIAQTMANRKRKRLEEEARRKQGEQGIGGLLGNIIGGVAGFLAGGPAGAVSGWQIGGGVGKGVTGGNLAEAGSEVLTGASKYPGVAPASAQFNYLDQANPLKRKMALKSILEGGQYGRFS